MTELESLQQLFKDVKDTDYIVKRMLEYKSEFQVCENCEYCKEVSRVSSIYMCIKSVIKSPTGCDDIHGYSTCRLTCDLFKRKEDVQK